VNLEGDFGSPDLFHQRWVQEIKMLLAMRSALLKTTPTFRHSEASLILMEYFRFNKGLKSSCDLKQMLRYLDCTLSGYYQNLTFCLRLRILRKAVSFLPIVPSLLIILSPSSLTYFPLPLRASLAFNPTQCTEAFQCGTRCRPSGVFGVECAA
jgi:hypothetical protein